MRVTTTTIVVSSISRDISDHGGTNCEISCGVNGRDSQRNDLLHSQPVPLEERRELERSDAIAAMSIPGPGWRIGAPTPRQAAPQFDEQRCRSMGSRP